MMMLLEAVGATSTARRFVGGTRVLVEGGGGRLIDGAK